jgi:hypothetical protein
MTPRPRPAKHKTTRPKAPLNINQQLILLLLLRPVTHETLVDKMSRRAKSGAGES